MQIKPRNEERVELDVTEWNDEARAFIRPLNGFESLVFNDYFFEFYNKEGNAEERFEAGFKAALMCLEDESGRPLLEEDDREAVKNGSFLPLFRLFAERLKVTNKEQNGGELDSAKKN